jgi:hypothetical protein
MIMTIGSALVTAEPDLGIDELAAVVRDEMQKARQAWSNALGHAMAAGDALIQVQPKIAERGINWKKWLRENCFVASSTAQLYMQLARHREQIEAELRRNVELSLRAARRLISAAEKSSKPAATENMPREALATHWDRATKEERTAFLDIIGVGGILGAMSAKFGAELRDRVPAPKRKSNGKPFTKTLNLTANRAREVAHRSRH